MATRPEIPYYAPAETLPAPLPTMDQILDCDVILKRSRFDRTVRYGEHYVIKYGTGLVNLQEGENMLFIKQVTTIPVPTIYALYREGGYNVIVMEYVRGTVLKKVWPQLPLVGKETFTKQIRRYIEELRDIPSPGYYGGIWEQGVLDPLLTCRLVVDPRVHPSIQTPSRTEGEWCEMMINSGFLSMPDMLPYHQEWVKHKFRTMFSNGHRPVFTHCHIINRSDLMMRPDGVIVPLGWSMAGWYPSYWEYCHASEVAEHKDDWTEWIGEIFKGMEYVAELGWVRYWRRYMMTPSYGIVIE